MYICVYLWVIEGQKFSFYGIWEIFFYFLGFIEVLEVMLKVLMGFIGIWVQVKQINCLVYILLFV